MGRNGNDELKPLFFSTPQEFRDWLDEHHETEAEVVVGYYKKGTGKQSMTWPESVDQALCYGWIDGVRRSIDEESYSNRFTPRTQRSTWSAVNIKRVGELTEMGLMRPAGLKAFEARTEDRMNRYSSEQKEPVTFDPEMTATFQANDAAWSFFQAQPPSYRKTATWWVISAKKPETRQRRLASLIANSANGKRIDQLTRPGRVAPTG
jgi:uncharacterized protein YdeI (YjbR/CyaY-like superfamily)